MECWNIQQIAIFREFNFFIWSIDFRGLTFGHVLVEGCFQHLGPHLWKIKSYWQLTPSVNAPKHNNLLNHVQEHPHEKNNESLDCTMEVDDQVEDPKV